MTDPKITPRLLRTKSAAAYLGLSPWSLRKLAQDGKIPFIADTQGSPFRFDRVDLDRYIEHSKTTS